VYRFCFSISMLLVYPAVADTLAPIAGTVQTATEMAPAEAVSAQRAALEQRVASRWAALIRRDFETAYSFTSPEYRRLFSLKDFMSSFGSKVGWQRVEVVDINIKGGDAAAVGVNLYFVYYDAQTKKPLDMKTYVQESWVLVDGQWWYVVKD